MPDKTFLEEYPLYRKFQKYFGYSLNHVAKPAISMHCDVCDSQQTFNMINEYFDHPKGAENKVSGIVSRPVYLCRGCERFKYFFLLQFHADEDAVTKVGQLPAWSIAVPRRLAKTLGEHTEDYKKGLICESQGYGIGAFAYYRRIVEDIIEHLLDDIAAIVPGPEQDRYLAALEKTRRTHVAQEKIELVKDVLPTTLRPDGMNPLAILHDVLSEGLHAESDERCLSLAATVREVLTFLITQVAVTTNSTKTFTDSMRKLLDRKAAAPGG